MRRNVLMLMLLNQALTFEQNDYTIKIHHLKKTYVNPKYFNNYYIVYGHYNRTHPEPSISAHGELYKKMNSPGFKVLSQVYIGIQNVYKIFAPLRFMMDACQILRSNLFGVDLVKTLGNITNCPIEPGFYYINNYYIDSTKFPPNFPAGNFMVHLTLLNYNVILTNVTLAYEVKYK